jgi:hypothetical protein
MGVGSASEDLLDLLGLEHPTRTRERDAHG